MIDRLSDMGLRGQAIQVHLEPLDRLESLMVEVHEWKESADAVFLQKDSNLTLLEVKITQIDLEITRSAFRVQTSFKDTVRIRIPTYTCPFVQLCITM